jgi:hypothetical protein
MRVGVILGPVVSVLRIRLLRRKFLEPLLEIGVQAAFVIVDEANALQLKALANEILKILRISVSYERYER